MKNGEAVHKQLQPGDTQTLTVGCRHNNPDHCMKNGLPKVCAFVRADGICQSPPKSWQKQYQKLRTTPLND
jgi:hypothetical protein